MMDRLNDYDDLERAAQGRARLERFREPRQRQDPRSARRRRRTSRWSNLQQLAEDAGRSRLHPEEPARLRADAAGRAQDRRKGADATSSRDLKKDQIGQHELDRTAAAGRAHRRQQTVRIRRPLPARSAEDGDERRRSATAPARRCRLDAERFRGLPDRTTSPARRRC